MDGTAEDDGKDDPESVYNVLKAGDYVNLELDTQDEPLVCMVLYDRAYNEEHKTNYGIQLVAMRSPKDPVGARLGSKDPRIETDAPDEVKNGTDLEKAVWSYNNVIETLNNAVQKYTGPKIKSVRSIGSVPDAPLTDASGMFSGEAYSWFPEEWENLIKDSDDNSDPDLNQLRLLDSSTGFGGSYYEKTGYEYGCFWLASRYAMVYTDQECEFHVRVSYYHIHWQGDCFSFSPGRVALC